MTEREEPAGAHFTIELPGLSVTSNREGSSHCVRRVLSLVGVDALMKFVD